MKEFISFLNGIQKISTRSIEIIESMIEKKTLEKGAFYIREREYARQFAFMESGIVRAFYTDTNAKEYTKNFFMNPSIIGGYASLISGKPALFSQQAVTNCELLCLDYHQFTGCYDQHPDLERLGRKFAENYFVDNEKKEIELVTKNADDRYLEFRKKFEGLEQNIPQYQVASYLGISATQLSRIRRNLKKD